jgi:hypothetical protein
LTCALRHLPRLAARTPRASMNCDTVVGYLKRIAVIKLQNGPTRLYCNPCPGTRFIRFAAHCYLYAIH